MADPKGFLRYERTKARRLPIAERTQGYAEFELSPEPEERVEQAARCMDCGIPFCHQGCPLGNLIPEWNDHVFRGNHEAARGALLETNNFPEITGRVCPAPCEAACVLNLEQSPVRIKMIERAIADDLLEHGLAPAPCAPPTGKRVAVVGSGPAGLAAAQQLCRRGHEVTLFERDAAAGGLLRYGIPDFKLEKSVLDARIAQMREEGVTFHCNHAPSADELTKFDGVVLAVGARVPRELPVEGRALAGIHPAMDFLAAQNRRNSGELAGDALAHLHAAGKNVIVLGGGDTGSDCVGTCHRQGAASVTSLELMPAPPEQRRGDDLWPDWPRIFRTSSSHEEGGTRLFAIQTMSFEADANEQAVAGLRICDVRLDQGKPVAVEGTERVLPAELVLLAMGFVAVEDDSLYEALGTERAQRGTIATRDGFTTHAERVVVCGDAYRGASLVVWAIADGRRAAEELHQQLGRA